MSPIDRSRLPLVGPTPPFQFAAIRKDRLKNQLAVWTAEHRGLPLVSILLVFPSGSAADFEGYEGLAALTADMLDEGSGDRSAIDINAAFARIGAHLDIDVSSDATVLSVSCLSRFATQALELMADCVMRPRLADADFDRIRQLRRTRLMQIRDMASAVADRAFMQLVYGAHPYGHMALGTEEALRQITIEDVRAFHQRIFRPASATLVASGEISPAEFQQMAGDAFGGWMMPPAASLADPTLAPPPPEPAHRLALVNKTGAAQAEIRIGEVGVSRSTPDYHPLIVLNMVLGGQFVSRINMKLRQEKGLTYGARTSFDFRRGRGPFMLQTSVQIDGTADAVQDALKEIDAIRSDRPPTSQEVEAAKAALTRGYTRNFETVEQVARAMAQLLLYGLPDNYFDTFAMRVGDVDVEQVRDVAVRHLNPGKLATAIVADAALVGPQLTRAGLGEPAPLLPRL
jgi:predicted Zn-dependent peptidase